MSALSVLCDIRFPVIKKNRIYKNKLPKKKIILCKKNYVRFLPRNKTKKEVTLTLTPTFMEQR
jgi:hypothetical protein